MSTNTPAGWYPDPNDASILRYWDGSVWTMHTAPSQAAPAIAPVASISPPPAPAAFATTPARVAPPIAAGAPRTMSSTRKWIIGGSIAAGVIVVGSVGAAIGSGGRGGDENAGPAPTASVSVAPGPSEEPAIEVTPSEAPASDADPVAFSADANSHINDINKDLDDIVVTVQEGGFFRLISNYAELAFNLGQLEALDVPASVATTWPAALTALDASMDAYSDAITTEDSAAILAAVDGVRLANEAARAVVNSANG